jgi:hypothetical protein
MVNQFIICCKISYCSRQTDNCKWVFFKQVSVTIVQWKYPKQCLCIPFIWIFLSQILVKAGCRQKTITLHREALPCNMLKPLIPFQLCPKHFTIICFSSTNADFKAPLILSVIIHIQFGHRFGKNQMDKSNKNVQYDTCFTKVSSVI